jgi:type IV secretion system protein VirB10
MSPSTVSTDGVGDKEGGEAAPTDPYADIKASLEAKLNQPVTMPATYNGADYNAMTQQMIENSIAMAGGMGGGMGGGAGSLDQNLQRVKDDFFNKSFSEGDYNDLPFKKVKMKSMYTLKEGDIIDGLMISGIDSTLPGKIIAHVAKDVYDSVTGKHLLIPQGTELVGRYSDAIAYAQDRVAFGWTRMNFENGDSINLGNMAGYDEQGYSGVHDQVDNHYFRLFGQIALISFFQSVPALINPTESSSSQEIQTVTSTEQQVVGTDDNGNPIVVTLEKTEPVTTTKSKSSGGQDEFQSDFKDSYGALMAETGVELAKRNMTIQPTLRVRQGAKFKVIVTQDMVIPPTGI